MYDYTCSLNSPARYALSSIYGYYYTYFEARPFFSVLRRTNAYHSCKLTICEIKLQIVCVTLTVFIVHLTLWSFIVLLEK